MEPGSVYALALTANLFFSTASMVFSHYSRKFSPEWMNMTKVAVAMGCFLAACAFTGVVTLPLVAVAYLALSGLLGLCIGDLFLFRAYATLGAGRSLVLYSFQPLLLGIYGSVFLGQTVSASQSAAVACMMACLGLFVLERNRLHGQWDLKSFLWAFTGILLDGVGVMLTRTVYEMAPTLGSMQVNVIRCGGALLGFLVLSPKGYARIIGDFRRLPDKERWILVIACLCGTFLSLSLYLAALKHAHMASLTALAITGPVWVSLLECLWARRLPNRYLSGAFLFFVLGFWLMTR